MRELEGKVAWITGAGSGIGEAAAKVLGAAGATLVLTGRRTEPLEAVRAAVEKAGGRAEIEVGDMTDASRVAAVVSTIVLRHGRLDILVSNAGTNIRDRTFAQLTPEGIDTVVRGNLSASFYVVSAVLPMMRAQQDGIIIHTGSWAGRFISAVSGAAYTAAKHGVIAMSHALNMEEFVHGIRSSVINPAEVATPILDLRPVPVSAEDRARMVQPEDVGEVVLFIATRPKHICLNEVLISPTWNRFHQAPSQPK
jgi:NADP-dependent 3-hydroxy acid dehydrogenase YdfG